jgi:hypothetical protein
MRNRKCGVLVGAVLACGQQVANAQLEISNSGDSCAQIESLRKAGKIGEARNQAQACLDALNQEANASVAKMFPTQVGGWQRASVEENQALGFTNVSSTYKKGEHAATVSLTGGNVGGGALGGVLGGIAKFGIKNAGKQVKVAGLAGSVQADGSVMVTLDDGSFLGFSCPDFNTADEALAGLGDLIDAFPVADINNKLK